MKRIICTAVLLGAAAIAAAQTPSADFVGVYHDRTADSVTSLAILPDQTFCFAMMAGALDIQAPGKWEYAGTEGQDTLLTFTRTSTLPSRFVLSLHEPVATVAGSDPAKPELIINTAAFAVLQPDAVFGSSDQTDTPANLAPMFSPGQNGFSRSERLPLTHRYLFLGYPAAEGGWHISRFDIGHPRHNVRLNLSEEAMQAGTVWQGRFGSGRLLLGQNYDLGTPSPLKPDEAQAVRQNCLNTEPDHPHITLFKPQAEYRMDKLPQQRPWFGDSAASAAWLETPN